MILANAPKIRENLLYWDATTAINVYEYSRKSLLTGLEVFIVVFLHETEKIPWKKNLVIFENISQFIWGLTAEDTNSQVSQNRARLYSFKVVLNLSKSLPDLK